MKLDSQGDRVKYVRINLRNMSQSELAERSGVKQGALSKLERNKTNSTGSLAELAEVLGVIPKWLANGKGPMEYSSTTEEDGLHSQLKTEDVNLYQFADSRCEYGLNNRNTTIHLPQISFPAYVFIDLDIDSAKCFAYKATDNSMANTIRSGDHLLIDTTRRRPETHSGRIFAIAHGDTCQFRYMHTTISNTYRAMTESNADKIAYPDREIEPSQLPLINIVGMVRWIAGER